MNQHIKALIGIGLLTVVGLVATPLVVPLLPVVVTAVAPATTIPAVVSAAKTAVTVAEVVTVTKTVHHTRGAVHDKIRHNDKTNNPAVTGEPGVRGSS